MKTGSLTSKIVATLVAAMLVLMGITPYLASNKAYADDDASLEGVSKELVSTEYTGEVIDLGSLGATYSNYPVVTSVSSATSESPDTVYCVVDGAGYAKDAGTYNVTLRKYEKRGFMLYYYYEATGKHSHSATWTIEPKEITVPEAAQGLVYNGQEQVGVDYSSISNYVYESEILGLFGFCSKATNATEDGEPYYAALVLKEPGNTVWSDDSLIQDVAELESISNDLSESLEWVQKNVRIIPWQIAKCTVEMPTNLNYVYTGSEIAAIPASDVYELTEGGHFSETITNEATNVGDYIAALKLKDTDNYKWENKKDATEDAEVTAYSDYRKVNWSITPATAEVLQGDVTWTKGSKEGVELVVSGLSKDSTQITANGGKLENAVLYDEDGAKVEGIEFTGKDMDPTTLTASAAALEKLAAGKYTVKFEYSENYTGPVETTLTVAEATVAKTGDSAGLIAMVGLAVLAAAGAGVALSMRRRQN